MGRVESPLGPFLFSEKLRPSTLIPVPHSEKTSWSLAAPFKIPVGRHVPSPSFTSKNARNGALATPHRFMGGSANTLWNDRQNLIIQLISIHPFTACHIGTTRACNRRELTVDVHITSQKRKEQRFSVDLPVEISWYDPKGNRFTERNRIQDISKMGCRFKLQVEL